MTRTMRHPIIWSKLEQMRTPLIFVVNFCCITCRLGQKKIRNIFSNSNNNGNNDEHEIRLESDFLIDFTEDKSIKKASKQKPKA